MTTGFGEYLVLRGLVTSRAVLHVLKKRAQVRPHLGELAARREWLTWGQVLGVVGLAERGRSRFGETAVRYGLLTEQQVEQLLAEQAAATPTLEQCLLDLELVSPERLEQERKAYELCRSEDDEERGW